MKLAMKNFAKLPAANKVLMLGGMAELGEESLGRHKAIAGLIQEHNWKAVEVLVGGDFLKFDHPFTTFTDAAAAETWLQDQQFENTHLLIRVAGACKWKKCWTNLKRLYGMEKKLFPHFEPELVELIEKNAVQRSFNAGDIIMRTGQYIKSTALVLEGQIKIYRENPEGGEFLMYYRARARPVPYL